MQYYSFVGNFNELSAKLHFILKTSCARLLAAKFSLGTLPQVYAKYGK